MQYFIELPFSPGLDADADKKVSDELMRVHGLTLMRISGRQFDRLTKAFQRQGWRYHVAGLADAAEGTEPEILATMLFAGHSEIPSMVWAPGSEKSQ